MSINLAGNLGDFGQLSGGDRRGFGRSCAMTRPMRTLAILFATVVLSCTASLAQTAVGPAPAAPSEPNPVATGCQAKMTPPALGGPTVVATPGAGLQHKSWQPPGGVLQFSVVNAKAFTAGAAIEVCFRWQKDIAGREDSAAGFIDGTVLGSQLSSDGKTLTVTASIPDITDDETGVNHAFLWYLVPVSEVRILAFSDPLDPSKFTEARTSVGITSAPLGMLLSILVLAAAFFALWKVKTDRAKFPGAQEVNPFLALISTPNGFASLSQFQMLLWTFVVGASAVYVMTLSGNLIEITSGTLVLLGISGASTVAAKVQSNAQDTAAQATGTPVTPPPEANHPRPRWSDLIVNLVQSPDKAEWRSEIDVTRVQMLFFTVITAGFVIISVVASYVIPTIPDGFQILMGISNALYVGGKLTQKT